MLDEVKMAIRDQVRSGVYRPGQFLPSERVLAEQLQTQRKIVHAAIEELTDEGFLDRRFNCRPVVVRQSDESAEVQSERILATSQFPSSRLVALVMWHGGQWEQGATAQQLIFWGINQELGPAGYHAVYLNLGATLKSEEDNAQREAALLQYALDNKFGGILFYPYAYERNQNLVRKVAREMPLIVIDRMLPGVETDYAGMQNEKAMYDALTYLVKLGHRRIAYVTNNEPIVTVQDRLKGYIHAMEDHFGPSAFEMVLPMTSIYNQSWPVFDIVFRQKPQDRPTAVLCLNDYDAVHVAMRLETLGLKVNRDVSIVGCDNLIHALPNGRGLTTIVQPFERIGAEAAKLFIRRTTESSPEPIHIEVPATMVIRDSCRAIVD